MKPDSPTDHAPRPAQLPPHQEISAKMSAEAFPIPVKANLAMPPKAVTVDMGHNVVARADVPAPAKVDLPVLHVGQPAKAGEPCPPGAAAAPRVESGAHGPAAKPDVPAPKIDAPAPKVEVPAPKVETRSPGGDSRGPSGAPCPPEQKPPVEVPKPPVEAPKPPAAPPPVEHKPPVDKVPCPPEQKPPVEAPKPPVQAPKPEHKPPVDKVPCPPDQKPPVEVPKPPVHAPKPEHKPPVDKVPCPPDQKPPVEVPKPPVHAPKPPEQKPPVDKTPCPPDKKPPEQKPPVDKTPCPPDKKPPEHKPPVDKTPCPPDKKPPEHKPPVDKTPCPPDKKPPEHKPPVDKTPCPPDEKPPVDKTPCPPKPPVDTPPPPKPPVDTPCPPKPPVDTPPPPKPPVDTPPPPKPPVDVPPPPKPPVDVPPPPKPPVDVPPPIPTPVPRPIPEARPIAVRYSPPAEPMRPMLPEQRIIPPAAEVTNTPAAVRIETGSSQAEVTIERRIEVTPAVRQEVPADKSGKVIIQEGQHGSVTRERQEVERERGIIVPGLGRASEGHKATEQTTTGIITGERQHVDRSREVRTQGGETTVVVDTRSGEGAQVTQPAQVVESTRIEGRAASSASVVEVQSPAAGADQVPGQVEYRKSWVDVGVSSGLHDKSTTGTVTLGTHLNDQNYIYGQTTRDLTNNKQGDSSLMYGHTLLSPYNADGTVRRGNVNVEAGVLLGTGTALEGSKLPLFGHTAVRLGVNGYYSLDKEGKTNLYGGADYASSPKQADATIGISHTMGDVTVAAGYQVSKVAGYEAGRYITPSATVKISDRTSFYVGAAISAQGKRQEDRVNAGFRIAF